MMITATRERISTPASGKARAARRSNVATAVGPFRRVYVPTEKPMPPKKRMAIKIMIQNQSMQLLLEQETTSPPRHEPRRAVPGTACQGGTKRVMR